MLWLRSEFSPTVEWSNLKAVGPNLYAISGPIEDSPCSSLSFLDCRTHSWVESPSFRFAGAYGAPGGSIYLPGSCENPESWSCMEEFNTKTQTWKPVPTGKWLTIPENLEGKIYTTGKKGLAFDVKEMTVESVGWDKYSDQVSVCIIQNIAYYYKSSGEFLWYDQVSPDYIGRIEGIEELPKFDGDNNVKLVDYGGKLLVLWDKYVGSKKKMIWCAVIKLKRRNNGKEMWGKVEWCNAVLTVPKSYEFVYAVAATL